MRVSVAPPLSTSVARCGPLCFKLRKTVAPCQLPLPCSEKVSFTPEFLTHGLMAAVLHRERRPVGYTSVSHLRCLGQLSDTGLAFERSAIGRGAPSPERLLPVKGYLVKRPWWLGTTVRAGPEKVSFTPKYLNHGRMATDSHRETRNIRLTSVCHPIAGTVVRAF